MAVLEWPGDIYHAMVECLNGTDPITLQKQYEQSVNAMRGISG